VAPVVEAGAGALPTALRVGVVERGVVEAGAV
jgi:hypothetical protein